jgi:hypothetical protein
VKRYSDRSIEVLYEDDGMASEKPESRPFYVQEKPLLETGVPKGSLENVRASEFDSYGLERE